MELKSKTKKELIEELTKLSQRVAKLEKLEAECRKTKEELKLYKAIFSNSKEAIAIVDPQGHYLEQNPAHESLLGYSSEELRGKTPAIHLGEEVFAKIIKELKTKGIYRGELVTHTKYGKKLYICLIAFPIFNEKGEIICYVGIKRDITKQRQTEEALRKSEERYRSLVKDVLDSTKVGIFILDSNFQVVWVNRTVENYFGLRREDVLGKDKRDLIRLKIKNFFKEPEEFAKKVLTTYENNTYIENFECYVVPDKGRKARWLEHWSQPIHSGLYAGGRVEHYYDITMRKQMQEALLESERKYKAIFEHSPEIIILLNQEGKVLDVNKKVYDWFGYTSKEIIGKVIFELPIFSERDKVKIRELFYHRIHGKRIMPYEFDLFTKRGEKVVGLVHSTTLKDEKGEIKEILMIISDITALKQAEEESAKIQAQLFQAQKMEAIGLLAGGIAHDFNNLLTTIQGHTQLALTKIDKADPLYQNLTNINRACSSGARLIRQLLLFGRKQPMDFIPLNLNKTVEDLLKIFRRLLGENIIINTELAPELWIIQADPGTIEQVIMNLSINAKDAMPKGGMLTIKTENVLVNEEHCRLNPEAHLGKFVCLTVKDTGIGMDREIMQHIFEPFFTTKSLGTRSGLGLAVVYGIVKQHGGWVEVFSEPGKGSTFKVYLPAIFLGRQEKTEEEITLEKFKGKGERILLVEDEEGVREFVKEALSENGYFVFTATTVKEALSIFEKEGGNFHLILTDVVLPDKSGLELVDELLSRQPRLAILLSSGYTGEKSQSAEINQKGLPFLPKPYTLTELLKAVKEAIK